jgi:hypothetical protein
MTYIHTARWVHHPNREMEIRYNKLVLDSLEKSGDLEKEDGSLYYKLSGGSLKSISDFAEQERRHKEALWQAKSMKWLTIALVFVGIIQALTIWGTN